MKERGDTEEPSYKELQKADGKGGPDEEFSRDRTKSRGE